MQVLSAYQDAERLVARLTKEATLNLAACMARLRLVTRDFSVEFKDLEAGAHRDFVLGILWTTNETVSLLNSLGAGALVTALRMGQTEAMEWYDKAIQEAHAIVQEHPLLQEIHTAYSAFIARIEGKKEEPTPEQQAQAAALDEHFGSDDEEPAAPQPATADPVPQAVAPAAAVEPAPEADAPAVPAEAADAPAAAPAEGDVLPEVAANG